METLPLLTASESWERCHSSLTLHPRQDASRRLLPSSVCPPILTMITLIHHIERPQGAANIYKVDEGDPIVTAQEQPNYKPGALDTGPQ